ncbi:MAG: NADPH-dependent oxidoreductase [Enhydrobacter sp.]|nr:MAG: NADPH-dependent oxidoreductase [Enhydrobacter sp.]
MDSLTPTANGQADDDRAADDRAAALARRYGAAMPKAGPWNETIASLLAHRSVRGYRSDPLPSGTLETLVAAAQSAASSSNLQLWSVIAVDDPAKKKMLAEIAGNQTHIEQCPLYLCWVADLSRNERLGREEKAEFETLPWLETFLVAGIDAALAAQNAVVAAESLGLSTVYIGAMRNDPIRVAGLLGLPERAFVVFGLCVGYATETAQGEVKPRLPQATVLHRDRYAAAGEPARRASYDKELDAFSRRHEMAATTWTQRVLNRMGPLRSMTGRETLRQSLRKLGFEIR